MPDLIPSPSPIGQIPLVTTEAPRSPVNPNDIARSGEEMGRGLKEAGAGLMDLATPVAEAQAASDLQNQKVTLGPDGKVQVLNPARSIIFGQAGDAYGRAVQAGTVAQAMPLIDGQLTDIHQKHLGDPAGQKAADQAFVQGLKGGTGNPLVDAALMGRAGERAAQHEDSNLDFTTRIQLGNTERSLTAIIQGAQEDLRGMARNGVGPGDPHYDSTMATLNEAYNQRQSNPLLKQTAEQVAQEKKHFGLGLAGEGFAGQIPKLIDSQGMIKTKAQADEMLAQPMDGQTRAYLRFEFNRLFAEATPKWNEETQAFAAKIENVRMHLAQHPEDANSPDIQQMVRLGRERQYPQEPQLEALVANAPFLKSMGRMTPEQQDRALGVTGPPGSPAEPGAVPGNETPQPAGFTSGGAFDLQSYKNRTAQIESGGRENPPDSSTGAFGKYQFISTTAAKYGVTRGGDQEAGMDRLTADNRADLQKGVPGEVGLGRDATPAETYLAHQQGSKGALALLNHPDQRAGDLVGDTAIRVNGGNPNAPASQFVKLWEAKFNGASPAGQPRWSDAQVRANPWLNSYIFQKDNQDPAERRSYFNAIIGQQSSSMNYGALPSPEQDAAIKAMFEGHKDDPGWQETMSKYEGQRDANLSERLTPEQRQQWDSASGMAASQMGGDPYTKERAAEYMHFRQENDKQWKDNPIAQGGRFGLAPPVRPLDMSSQQSIAQGISERGAMASSIQALRGQTVSALDPPDIAQFKSALATPDPAVKAGIYSTLSSLPGPIRDATLAKLGGGEPLGMAEAGAGSLVGVDPDMAQSIFRGLQAMKADKRFDPEDEGAGSKQSYLDARDAAFPPSIFSVQDRADPAGPYASLGMMIKARYADLKAQSGTFQYDKATVDQAVKDVTGGVLSHNGGSFIAPVRGMSQSDFDRVLAGVTDQDLKGAVTRNGQKVTADYIRQNGQLESLTDGTYNLRLGRDPMAPTYAYSPDANGKLQKTILDLRNIKPAAAPAIDPTDVMIGAGGT